MLDTSPRESFLIDDNRSLEKKPKMSSKTSHSPNILHSTQICASHDLLSQSSVKRPFSVLQTRAKLSQEMGQSKHFYCSSHLGTHPLSVLDLYNDISVRSATDSVSQHLSHNTVGDTDTTYCNSTTVPFKSLQSSKTEIKRNTQPLVSKPGVPIHNYLVQNSHPFIASETDFTMKSKEKQLHVDERIGATFNKKPTLNSFWSYDHHKEDEITQHSSNSTDLVGSTSAVVIPADVVSYLVISTEAECTIACLASHPHASIAM